MTEMSPEELMISLREIDPEHVCPKCNGSGVLTYPTTSTWHGGIGGTTLTPGPCNKCWGSGDSSRPWSSHRRLDPASDAYRRGTEAMRKACLTELSIFRAYEGEEDPFDLVERGIRAIPIPEEADHE